MKKIDIRLGDTLKLIKDIPDNSIDLVITSPPYVDVVNYGDKITLKKNDDYIDWLLELFNHIYRVLKPTGSFILNINDKVESGYRTTYIFDLISRNSRETNLKLYDTYFWHKKNGIPNGSNKRFRNMTEYIFHFCKDYTQMKFYMDRVMQPSKDNTNQRYKYNWVKNAHGEVIDGERVKKSAIRDVPKITRPDNVFRFNTAGVCRDNTIKHPAPFNKELPLYFINLLTDEKDMVLDVFSGIGTTGIACKEINRTYIGFELNEKYYNFSIQRIQDY